MEIYAHITFYVKEDGFLYSKNFYFKLIKDTNKFFWRDYFYESRPDTYFEFSVDQIIPIEQWLDIGKVKIDFHPQHLELKNVQTK